MGLVNYQKVGNALLNCGLNLAFINLLKIRHKCGVCIRVIILQLKAMHLIIFPMNNSLISYQS